MTSRTDTDSAICLNPEARRSSPYLLFGLVLVAIFAVCYNGDIDGPLDLYHEGDRLATYDAVCDGALPYRDYYVSHGLGEDVLKPFVACKLFGPSVESLRRLGRNSYVYSGYLPTLGPLMVLIAAIAWLRDVRACIVLAALLAVGLLEISERPALAMAAVAALGMWHHCNQRGWLVVAGVSTVLAGLYSTEVGIFVGLAATFWLALHDRVGSSRGETSHSQSRLNSLSAYLAGAFCILLPFLIWCGGHGILGDFLENLRIQFGLRGEVWPNKYPIPSWTCGEPIMGNMMVNAAMVGMFYLAPLSYGLGVYLSLSNRSESDVKHRQMLLFASLLGGCFWLSPFAQSDIWHVAYAAGTFYFFVAVLVLVLSKKAVRPTMGIITAVCAILSSLTFVFVSQGGTAAQRLTGHDSTFIPPHLRSAGKDMVLTNIDRVGRIKIPVEQAADLNAILGLIGGHSESGDYILDLSDQPLIYFLSQRRCPTRFHLMSQCNSPILKEMMVDEVRSKSRLPRIVIYPGTGTPASADIGKFITENYRPLAVIGGLQFFSLNGK